MLLAVVAVLVALGLASGSADAAGATIQVNTTADGGSCPMTCSLRAAIAMASNTGGDPTIEIPSGTYVVTNGVLSITVPMTLAGAGAASTVIDANGTAQALSVSGSGNLTATGLTIQDAHGGTDGAGVEVAANDSATLNNDIVQNNSSTAAGGGIYDAGNLTLNSDVITNNVASGNQIDGGGLYISGSDNTQSTVTVTNSVFSDNSGYFGGAIQYATGSSTQHVSIQISDSLLTGNTSTQSGGAIDDDTGSGIASLTVTNTTIAGNTAVSGGGGGVRVGDSAAPTVFVNDTIASNQASSGGDVYSSDHTSDWENTIIAQGVATAGGAANPSDCGGEALTYMQSEGHNLDDASGCNFNAAGDLVNTNPKLQALANNGGPTQTLALAVGSPAIDAGAASPIFCPATDQRGLTRPQGSACDIGAYEAAPAPITNVGGSAPAGGPETISATVANPDLQAATLSVEWGASAGAYTSTSASQTAPAQSAATGYSFALLGATPGTTYHYVVVATNARGSVTSADQTFVVPAPIISTPPPTTAPTATVPSNAFRVLKLSVGAKGEIAAKLSAPDAGLFSARASFTVTTRRTEKVHGKRRTVRKKVTYRYASARLKVTAAGTTSLRLKISRAAARELKRRHRASVRVVISFTPTGGTVATKKPSVTVRLSARGRYS